MRIARLALLLVLTWWTWRFLTMPFRQDVIGVSLLHLVSIPFHEAGHVLFSPFGDLLTALGGSLMQVLVPLACAIAFLTTSPNAFGALVMGWWAGENLLDVAMYVDDARSLQLVLLGGQTGAEVEGHDWERILTVAGALHRDHQIALALQIAGGVTMIATLLGAAVFVVKQR